MGLLQMPSVKNVKKQFCCTRGPYRDPLVHCSLSVSRNYSLTIREQLLWQSLSHTQWMRPCQATTSSTSPNLQTPWRYTTYPTGSHVNLHADGTAKDTDKGSFSYTRVTLPVSLVFTSSASFFLQYQVFILYKQLALLCLTNIHFHPFGLNSFPTHLEAKQILFSLFYGCIFNSSWGYRL